MPSKSAPRPRVALTRIPDQARWNQFDQLAYRLGFSVSSALREAAFEWLAHHADDPTAERPVKPNPRALNVPDPFRK